MRFSMRRRVAFSETDAAGIVHFSRYAVWMEDCEHAFLRSLGFRVHGMDDAEGAWLFPRVHLEVDYARPLRFEEEVEVRLDVLERRPKVVTYGFQFVRGDEEVTRGKAVVVFARVGPEGMRAAPFPEALAAALDGA